MRMSSDNIGFIIMLLFILAMVAIVVGIGLHDQNSLAYITQIYPQYADDRMGFMGECMKTAAFSLDKCNEYYEYFTNLR